MHLESCWCVLCGELNESAEHLFLSCRVAQLIWEEISKWCRISGNTWKLEHHRDRTEVEATPVISMAGNGDDKLHIAMFPWLAFGHLLPFLQLAKLMASKGHKISFISTPRNIDRLPKIPQPLTHLITFIQINLPKLQTLPENAESTRDLPINKGFVGSPETLMGCYDDPAPLEQSLKRPKWVSFESEVRPTAFQVARLQESSSASEENVSDVYRLGATVSGCDAVVVRSCFDFEPDWLNLLKKLYKKPIVPAGLLPAVVNDAGDGCWPEMKQWLDMHPKGSVVYIAFGTETKPNQYELTQLALGLELSGLPFFWVLIEGSSDDEVVVLPKGFEDRTRGRGVVCKVWVPQFKIVSHDSVGGLLIHSGMSSVVEGLQLGKPLVLLPFVLDQGLIASYLVEKKMACMVHRDDVDGSFTPESVADSLSLVMVSEDGKMYREKAKEMMSLFGDINVQDKRGSE
ncbi:hypothetical protein E3N88_04883 [Mikania micrantha]|uniref:Glycosyltransferase n=1 Tax=Mikania micrantha TaxID=192012 RepID=A0A5N6PVQ6_9ASTR|nr:hypothetical protein E3N88_04883 [Mikania micrantha]